MESNSFHGPDSRSKPHFLLVPLMGQGHMIPMVDLARLLAAAGAQITFITTPVNTARIRPVIHRIHRSSLPIRFVDLRFPTAESGLPDGCENLDLIPSRDLFKPFIESLPLFRPQLELFLAADSAAPPDCIIFDSINSWAAAAAKDLGIPHLIFHGPSCFYMLCYLLLEKSQVLKTIAGDFDPFLIPGLTEPVEVMKAQVTLWTDAPGWEKIREDFLAAEESAGGIVMNTFEELEQSILEQYRKGTGKKIWSIGPVSISNKDTDSLSTRGEASSTDAQSLINWLDSKAPYSVLFVCFGSLVLDSLSQLIEIGRGLEYALSSSSSLSFIWVVKEAAKSEEVEKWLSGFEEKMSVRGMVIRGWVPQAMVLMHAAVGGFMTHCGWNSTLEAVAAGVVMATWPRYVGDQFLNEKLVVDVLKVGVTVGAKAPASLVNEKSGDAQVKGEDVGKAVERVMDGGKEGEERRRRARELGEKAREAMREGGSSFENLKEIIQFALQKDFVM